MAVQDLSVPPDGEPVRPASSDPGVVDPDELTATNPRPA